MVGRALDDAALAEVASAASEQAQPISDLRASDSVPPPLCRCDGPAERGRGGATRRRRAHRRSCQPDDRYRSGIMTQIELTVNGRCYDVDVHPHRNLLSVIRQEIGLTGTKEGCDDCECGACMVLAGRAAGERLLLPRCPGRRPRDHHRRGPGCSRRPPPVAGRRSLPRAGCSAGSARQGC